MWKTAFVFLLLPHNLFGDELDFELGVCVSRKEIIEFEPVVLIVSVINLSGERQTIHRALDPRQQYLKIHIIDPDGKTHVWNPPRIKHRGIGYMTLGPHEAVHHQLILTRAQDGWLNQSGKYQLAATYDYGPDAEEPLASSFATLTIKPAEGVNTKALEKFSRHLQKGVLTEPNTTPAATEDLKSIIRDYPKSDYAPWCYYMLGWAAQHQPAVDNKTRANEARKYYGKLLEKHSKFPLKNEVKYEMARELFRFGKRHDAIQKIEQLVDKDRQMQANNFVAAELFLLYEAREVLSRCKSKNQAVTFEKLPSHAAP